MASLHSCLLLVCAALAVTTAWATTDVTAVAGQSAVESAAGAHPACEELGGPFCHCSHCAATKGVCSLARSNALGSSMFGKCHATTSADQCCHAAKGTLGVDVSVAVSEAQWKCMMTPGGDAQGVINLAIARVYRSSGHVDQVGIDTLLAARRAGLPRVDAYIFPCFKCGDPARQLDETVAALRAAHLHVDRLWYDIEPYEWSDDLEANRAFIKTMIQHGEKLKLTAGVYTSHRMSLIVGNWTYMHDRHLPLWYPHYDNNRSFSDFKPFGGFTKPVMKQYAGDLVSACGFDADYNWHPSA